jgi:hypothetical protein
VFAICLHNLPEGLAIGVGFTGTDTAKGLALATGITIQDIPEGLVVAVALMAAGYGRAYSVAVGMASGLSNRSAPPSAPAWWSTSLCCFRSAWVSQRAPCCSSSATKSFPSRTGKAMRTSPPADSWWAS